MRYYLFVVFTIFLYLEGFPTNIDSLKKIAIHANNPHEWNKVAAYYAEYEYDTAQLNTAVERAYQLSVSQNDLNEMGIALYYFSFLDYDRNNMAEFYQHLQQALACFLKTKDTSNILLTMNDIGYYLIEIGAVDSAIITYKKLIDIAEKANDEEPNGAVYLNIANAYFYKMAIDSSVYYAQRALDVGTREKDTTVLIDAHNKLGLYARTQHHYKTALQHYEKTLYLCQKAKRDEELYFIYSNIAVLYNEWGKPEPGLEFAEKALNCARKFSNKLTYAKSLMRYGGILIVNHDYLAGIDSIKKGLLFKPNDLTETTYGFLRMAYAYQELSEPDSSRFYLRKVENNLAYLPERLKNDYLLQKSQLAFFEKKNDSVIFFTEQYLKLTGDPENLRTSKNRELYNRLSTSYEIMHNYEKALYYKKIAYNMQDSIYQQEQKKLVNEFYVRYQTAEKELENTILINEQTKLTLQRTRMMAAFVMVGILMLLTWLYVLVQRWRKKAEKSDLQRRISEKEDEYKQLSEKIEQRQITSYLKGLEAERNHLSKELHDNVSNNLLSLEMQLKNHPHLEPNIFVQMKQLRSQIRNISHELSPPIFFNITLPELIEDYVRFQNELTTIQLQFHFDPPSGWEDVSHSIALELYRIIQETCGNAIKYSQAKQITIHLEKTSEWIALQIKDNGKGMDVNKKQNGIGLNIIKSRAESLNGTFNLYSEIGKGTCIEVKIAR